GVATSPRGSSRSCSRPRCGRRSGRFVRANTQDSTRRRIMQKTQAARVLVSGLIVLALGCDSRRATSPSVGGDDLAVAASRASPSVLGQGRNIGRGVTIVLVHGAFADASGWQDVIPILQRDGFNVVAVQNPLSSLANDVAWTRRVLEAQSGPVVVDRKSTRLNSSHVSISYAVFCLKKKKILSTSIPNSNLIHLDEKANIFSLDAEVHVIENSKSPIVTQILINNLDNLITYTTNNDT